MRFPFLLLAFSFCSGSSSLPISFHPHKVISLPGAPNHPDFNLFAGYLNGSSNDTSIPIYYFLAEAIRVDPSTAPLVVWFNGGPGGSSLYGFFKEHGPYRITESGDTLTYHEFSWNQYANVLYLESPLGVGFSQNTQGDRTMNDLDTAEINFNALKDLMTRVHPNYADRDYYLSGQSYAGVFVPYFARRLLEGIESGEFKNTNFKGFAIGNPIFEKNSGVLAELMHLTSKGLVGLDNLNAIHGYWAKIEKGEKLTEEEQINIFIAYLSFYKQVGVNSPQHYNFIEHCFTETLEEEYHIPTEKKAISCFANGAIESYLNRADVQVAIHANASESFKWKSLNEDLSQMYSRDDNILPVYDEIFRLVNSSSFRVLIYNGDTDIMISPIQTIYNTKKIADANSMEIRLYEELQSTAWNCYGDFAGEQISYASGSTTMDVLTVRGAGHSVPTDLPAQAFQMIHNFIFTEDNHAINYSQPIRKH